MKKNFKKSLLLCGVLCSAMPATILSSCQDKSIKQYNIYTSITNGYIDFLRHPETIKSDEYLSIKIHPLYTFDCPKKDDIIVTGATIEYYDLVTGTLLISHAISDVVITATCGHIPSQKIEVDIKNGVYSLSSTKLYEGWHVTLFVNPEKGYYYPNKEDIEITGTNNYQIFEDKNLIYIDGKTIESGDIKISVPCERRLNLKVKSENVTFDNPLPSIVSDNNPAIIEGIKAKNGYKLEKDCIKITNGSFELSGDKITIKLDNTTVIDKDVEITIKPNVIPLVDLKITNIPDDAKIGKEYELGFEFSPEQAIYNKVEWSSSDPEIIEINKDGKIKCNSFGEVTIAVTLTQPGGLTKTATAKISSHFLSKYQIFTDPEKYKLDPIKCKQHPNIVYIVNDQGEKVKPSELKSVSIESDDEGVNPDIAFGDDYCIITSDFPSKNVKLKITDQDGTETLIPIEISKINVGAAGGTEVFDDAGQTHEFDIKLVDEFGNPCVYQQECITATYSSQEPDWSWSGQPVIEADSDGNVLIKAFARTITVLQPMPIVKGCIRVSFKNDYGKIYNTSDIWLTIHRKKS